MITGTAFEFTYMDIAVLAVLAAFAVINAQKGLAGAVLRFLPTLLGILLSWKMTSHVIKYVRESFIFPLIMKKISAGLDFGNIIPEMTLSAQNSIIEAMKVPGFIKNALISNNNSVVYNLFNAQTIKDYIAGFFANILISGAVIIILYFAGLIIGKLIIKALDILNDVPVIGFFSRAGGFVVGIIKGICVLWIIGIVITFFSCKPEAVEFMTKLQSSFIAGWIYDNNILLYLVLQIFA